MRNLNIQIREEEDALAFSISEDCETSLTWRELSHEDREHVLDNLAAAFKFFHSHLDSEDVPRFDENDNGNENENSDD